MRGRDSSGPDTDRWERKDSGTEARTAPELSALLKRVLSDGWVPIETGGRA